MSTIQPAWEIIRDYWIRTLKPESADEGSITTVHQDELRKTHVVTNPRAELLELIRPVVNMPYGDMVPSLGDALKVYRKWAPTAWAELLACVRKHYRKHCRKQPCASDCPVCTILDLRPSTGTTP